MRLISVLALLLVLALPAAGQVNGQLDQVEGKYILKVWGNHSERGYAAGFLLGEQGKAVFDDYFVGSFCSGSSYVYGVLRGIFLNDFAADEKYVTEAESMILGMSDAGVDLYNAVLGRDIDATDILVSNSIVDLAQATGRTDFGCSSLSSWGASTIGDPLLEGHLVITRHLDWSKHATLTANPSLVVHFPSEIDEAPWLSIGYAGFFGALSSVCQSGIGAFLNMGNVNAGTAGQPYQPILLSVRNGMEVADYDGDGFKTPADVAAAIGDRSRVGGTIIHVTEDDGVASDPIVIECNNAAGVTSRHCSDNTEIPGDNLAATNHFRLLYSPVTCSRYEALVDSLKDNVVISPERSWNVMAGAAGSYYSNIQAIRYIESAGILDWAVDSSSQPAYLRPPTTFLLEDLFAYPTHAGVPGAVAVLQRNYPNPFNPKTSIRFSLPEASTCRLTVHDLDGCLVRTLFEGELAGGWHQVEWDGRDDRGLELSSGVYVSLLDDGRSRTGGKMLLLK